MKKIINDNKRSNSPTTTRARYMVAVKVTKESLTKNWWEWWNFYNDGSIDLSTFWVVEPGNGYPGMHPVEELVGEDADGNIIIPLEFEWIDTCNLEDATTMWRRKYMPNGMAQRLSKHADNQAPGMGSWEFQKAGYPSVTVIIDRRKNKVIMPRWYGNAEDF